jgi:hypothetical protein
MPNNETTRQDQHLMPDRRLLRTQPEYQSATPPPSPPDHQPRDDNSTFGKKSNCHLSPTTPRRAFTPGVFDFCPYPFSAPMLEFANHEEHA